nr:hypothetical protein [Tanacetum cinerariifolium]
LLYNSLVFGKSLFNFDAIDQDEELEDAFPMACNFNVGNCSKLWESHEVDFVDQRSFLVAVS